jgi:hypothetical protein
LSIERSWFIAASAEEACDETWVPLLDQGLWKFLGRLLYLLLF